MDEVRTDKEFREMESVCVLIMKEYKPYQSNDELPLVWRHVRGGGRKRPPQFTISPSPFATSPSRANSSRSSFAISACVLLAASVPCSSNSFFVSGNVATFAMVALSL